MKRTKLTLQDLKSRRTSGDKPIYFFKGDFYDEPQSSSGEEDKNMARKSNQPDGDDKTEINREAWHRHPQGNSPTYSGFPSSTPWTRQALRNVRTPSTIMWGEMGTNDGGLNINIQPAQKPRKLQELTYPSIRAFQAEFRLYHLESKGQATLHGHISEKMVTVIDSLLGANNRYAHLLGHGREYVPDLPEFVRREYPWLHTPQRDHWEDLLEALKELRPEGGSFTLDRKSVV
jgi:hypothetical protein